MTELLTPFNQEPFEDSVLLNMLSAVITRSHYKSVTRMFIRKDFHVYIKYGNI